MDNPELEPVAWYYAGSDVECASVALDADLDNEQKANCTPLYAAPPQPTKLFAPDLEGVLDAAGYVKRREWRALTKSEVKVLWIAANNKAEFAELLEAKLKAKNI